MAARRRVTAVLEQQHTLRELGRIRFGTRKPTDAKRPGSPIEFPRVSSTFEDVVHEVAASYGGQPQRWEREHGLIEWDVLTEGPIAVACPPGLEVSTTAYEQWAGGFNTVRCDGETCEFRSKGRWRQHPCVCAERGIPPEERDCKKTTRILVMILGVRRLGRFRVDTKSHYASEELPATLFYLQQSGRAGWMRMARRERRVIEWDAKAGEDRPLVKKFPVIVVDAPFLPDEVLRIERSPDMAHLPAPAPLSLPPPSAPLQLTRGARPEVPARIEPRGPQPQDADPPPRDPPPIDLEAPAETFTRAGAAGEAGEPAGSGDEVPGSGDEPPPVSGDEAQGSGDEVPAEADAAAAPAPAAAAPAPGAVKNPGGDRYQEIRQRVADKATGGQRSLDVGDGGHRDPTAGEQ